MTCGLQEGITVEFPHSGVEVRPYTGDMRMKRRHYAHGDFELSSEAGRLVGNKIEEGETAFIKFDGLRGHRFYYPTDSLSFNYDLQRSEKAELTLLDARKILKRGRVEKNFGTASLEEIVAYIVDRRDDPFDVITDVRFVGEADPEETRTTPGFLVPTTPVVEIVLDHMTVDENNTYATLRFDGVSPFEALEQITEDFGLNWWVDLDGILWIGTDIEFGQRIGTVSGDNLIALKRYSVTKSENTTNTVMLKAPYSLTDPTVAGAFEILLQEKLQVIAEAKQPNIEGSLMALEEEESPIESPEKLKEAAERVLVQEILNDISGSIQINGMASDNIPALAQLNVGDTIDVDPSIEVECDKEVITGSFIIQSVHHRFDSRQGWEITCEVSRFPDPQAIQSKYVLYDPRDDETYGSLEAYNDG